MALIVEDGTGKSTAESFVSVADVTAYFGEVGGGTTWLDAGTTTAEKEAALRVATRYVGEAYEWPGILLLTTQALSWPRAWATDREGRDLSAQVPDRVVWATAEAAELHLNGSLLTSTLARGGKIKRKKVDVIETEWFEGAKALTTFPHINDLLAPIARPRASSPFVSLVRA